MTALPFVERDTESESWPSRTPFLDSFRATAACKRELERLNEDVVNRLGALHVQGTTEKYDVRVSPERCIIQLGPVALSIAWLRNSRASISEGELLVIVWRGVAAPRVSHHPERRGEQRTPSAVALWEEVLTPVAADEANWVWQPRRAGEGVLTSSDLATRCVQWLRDASVEAAATLQG